MFDLFSTTSRNRILTRRGHKRLNNGFIMRSFIDIFGKIWNNYACQGNLLFFVYDNFSLSFLLHMYRLVRTFRGCFLVLYILFSKLSFNIFVYFLFSDTEFQYISGKSYFIGFYVIKYHERIIFEIYFIDK